VYTTPYLTSCAEEVTCRVVNSGISATLITNYTVLTSLFTDAFDLQDLWEEVDLVVKGANYGWSKCEGLAAFGSNRDVTLCNGASSSSPYTAPEADV